MATIDYGGRSPYEVAEDEGRLDEFNKFTEDLYKGSTPQTQYSSSINLYDPSTYGSPSSGSDGGGGGGGRKYSAEEEDWLRRNPGDEHRMAEAFASNNFGGGGSRPPQSSGYQMPQNFTFNDPLTKQYEQLLQMQLSMYQQQQEAMRQAAEEAKAKRAQTQSAVDRLSQFMNQRISKLQGPAYTGTEADVLRTQLTDPIERDRTAAQQRAKERISARGLRPDDGLAQELMNLVDREYNEYRAKAQGSLASRQIEEERSREQEAQSLLQYLAMLPDAVARGDLDFVAYVQNLVATPGQHGIAIGDVLSELPTKRLNDALATLGMAPSMSGASGSAIQMLQLAQNQRAMQQQNAAGYWGQIGRSFIP